MGITNDQAARRLYPSKKDARITHSPGRKENTPSLQSRQTKTRTVPAKATHAGGRK